MAIDDVDVIDFIGVDEGGNVVLAISDHLEWDGKNEHIYILQQKLNRYLMFIENGEFAERFKEESDKPVTISVVALHAPSEIAKTFLANVERALKESGIGFRFQQRHFNSP